MWHGGGQTLNGFYPKPGPRNKGYGCGREYHLAPRCPWRDTQRWEGRPYPPERARPHRPPNSSISTETPVLPENAEISGGSEAGSMCEQSFVNTVHAGDTFMVSQGESASASDAGAPANLVCFSWLAGLNRSLE